MAVIEARREVLFVRQPLASEEVRLLKAVGFSPHEPDDPACDCPLCHVYENHQGEVLQPPALWCLDPTAAQATGLELSDTAQILVDRAKDRGVRSAAVQLPEGLRRAQVQVPMPARLLPFQQAGVRTAIERLERWGACIIADEMGLGKTVQAIACAAVLRARRVLVICPASLRLMWRDQISSWARKDAAVLDGPDASVETGPAWAVTNPQKLITASRRDPVKLVTSMGSDREGKALDKLAQEGGRQFTCLWVSDTLPHASHPLSKVVFEPSQAATALRLDRAVIRVPTAGHALVFARDYAPLWTHLAGRKLQALLPKARARGLGEWLASQCATWDLLILDEAHVYANPKAAVTKRVLGSPNERKCIAANATRTVALTGTPFSNRPVELTPMLMSLAPTFSVAGPFNFCMRYCGATQKKVYVRGGGGRQKSVWDFSGSSRERELQARLRREVMVRRLKKDVLQDLPPTRDVVIELDDPLLAAAGEANTALWFDTPKVGEAALALMVAAAADDAYSLDVAADRLAAELEGTPASELARLRRAVGVAKIPTVIAHAKLLLASKAKLVVFAHHREVVETLSNELPASVRLYGGMSEIEKQDAVTAFQQDPKTRVFIGGLRAASVGLTLTAADMMVFAEQDWSPAVISQARARIHRIGQQGSSVQYQHLVVPGTVEAALVLAVLRKQGWFDAAMDIGSNKAPPPTCTPGQQQECARLIAGWTESGAPFPPSTMRIVRELRTRWMRRAPTDAEVALVLRLQERMRG